MGHTVIATINLAALKLLLTFRGRVLNNHNFKGNSVSYWSICKGAYKGFLRLVKVMKWNDQAASPVKLLPLLYNTFYVDVNFTMQRNLQLQKALHGAHNRLHCYAGEIDRAKCNLQSSISHEHFSALHDEIANNIAVRGSRMRNKLQRKLIQISPTAKNPPTGSQPTY